MVCFMLKRRGLVFESNHSFIAHLPRHQIRLIIFNFIYGSLAGLQPINNMAPSNLNLLAFWVFLSIARVYSGTTEPNIETTPTQSPTTTTTTAAPTESTPIDGNTDLAECTCDLTFNGCDVNCCCDNDCTAGDRLAFSFCADQYTPVDSQTCVRSEIIFRENTPFEVNTNQPGLFCIQYDNYEERSFYQIPDPINGTAEFDRYESRYRTHSFRKQSTSSTVPAAYYKSGEPILTVHENLALGYLTQSEPLTTLACKDFNPAAFLVSKSTSCVREVTDLASQCTANPSLDGNTYFAGFKVVTNPELFLPIYDEELNGTDTFSTTAAPVTAGVPSEGQLYNSSYLVDVLPTGPHTCISSQGIALECDNITDIIPPPTLEAGKDNRDNNITVCKNTIQLVKYTMVYNGTNGIVSVAVTFTFRDTVAENLPLTQSFVTEFTQLGAQDTFRRSGNPGYIVGEPVMAGKLQTNTDTGQNVYAIGLDSDRNNWLTMVTSGSPADSRCGDYKQREPVQFGVNMRSGCFVSFFYENMTELCNLTQWEAWNALRGPDPADYIASFGNSVTEKVGDWVPILGVQDQPNPVTDRTNSLECEDVLTGLNIQIVYANVGALDNPQPKILGARYQYRYQDRLRYQCMGPYCQRGNEGLEQRFEISSSVEFIDISQPLVGVSAEIPSISARLPEDFFYPFS